jgi:hypothetical protein
MMKKQLLLGLYIAIILCAPTQVSNSHAAPLVKHNLDIAPNSQKSAKHPATSITIFASRGETLQRLAQPIDQIAQETPTPTITPPPVKKNLTPTRKPRPTSTPIPIPPSASPSATTLMILVSLIAVIVVIVGVWLNRSEK